MDQQNENKKPGILIRLLGFLLGLFFVLVGIYIWGKYGEGWIRYAGPIGVIGTGVIFINIGLRGKAKLF